MTRKRASVLQAPRPYKRQRGRAKKANDEDQDSSDEESRPKHVLLEEEKNEDEIEEEGGTFVDNIYIPPKLAKAAHSGVGERMVIEKIICENFKSYAGVKHLGPFHKNFTSIVGPNGNGKSNIIDAMLFVFGYKSSKIRVKKISVLIHKSDLVPNATSCAVTVMFGKIYDSGKADDDGEMRILPGSRISVTRKANASGHSEYILDGKKCKFPDVAKFLKDNGVDIIHNRFLILQGEVESIALMPPKANSAGLEPGLMEYLEDIIGTRRYLKCLIKLEERIKTLDFDREAKLQQVDLVEQEKRAMAEPVKKAKEYLREMNSKIRVEQQLLLAKDLDMKKRLEDIQEKKAAIEETMNGIVGRLDELKAANEEKDKAYNAAMKTFQGYEAEFKKVKTKLNTHETDYAKVNEQLKRSNEQRKKTQTEVKKTQAELERLDEEAKTHDEKMTLLQKREEELVDICKTEEASVEQQLAKLQKKIDNVIIDKTEADKCLMTQKAAYNEKKNVVETARSDLKIYKEQEESELTKYETYKQELEETKEKLKQKERESRNSSGNTNIEGLEASLAKATTERATVSAAEKEKFEEVTRLQSQYQESRDSMEGNAHQDRCFKLFTEEQKKGRLAGLYGRLKDLATIPEQFNVAATMATGIWDFFVCDTDDTATECIQVLKAHSQRAENFICLNRIQFLDQKMRQPFQCPNRSKRLFDLFEIQKPELMVAFYKAVTDTLVAENLTIASEIAYGPRRYRVVTLKGDLIDASGSMTGGGNTAPVGKLNSALAKNLSKGVSRDDLRRLESAVNKSKAELEEITARKCGLEQDIRKLGADIDRQKMKLKTFETEVQSLKSQIPLKEKRLQQQETKWKECVVDPKLLKEKEKVLKTAEKALEEITGPYELAEKEATKMKDRLHQLQVIEKGEINRNLATHKEQMAKVTTEMKKLTVNAKNYKKNHEKNTTKIEQLTAEKAKIEAEMLKLNDRKNEIEGEAKSIKEKADDLEAKRNEAKAEVDKMKESNDSNRVEENKLAKEKATAENKLGTIKTDFKACQAHLKKYEEGLGALKLKDIPEEEVEPLKEYTQEEIEGFRVNDLQGKLGRRTEKLKGKSPNLLVLEAYREKVAQFLLEVGGLDEVTSRRDTVRDAYIKAEAQRLSEFMEGYGIISKLKEMFRMISMGGDAELSILNKTDPFLAGVELCVRPANKAWKPIKHLSGGEKTLSSLALVFALHHFKPSPFYIMDEIDAALDFKNVSIIANYIKDRTKFTQFIIISLRSNMFELADTFLGVYKVDNMSYSMHLGVNKLLKNMQDKYAANSQPFPLTDDLNRRAAHAAHASQQSQDQHKENNADEDRQSQPLSQPQPQSQPPSQSQSQPQPSTGSMGPPLAPLSVDPSTDADIASSPSPDMVVSPEPMETVNEEENEVLPS